MAFYRLKTSICVQKLASLPGIVDLRFQSIYIIIDAGEIVESVTTPNQNGRTLIRYDGRCYRAWKEELQNAHIAERLFPIEIFNSHAEDR